MINWSEESSSACRFPPPPESAKTAPLNYSTTLGHKGQELFPRKGLHLSSDPFRDLLRRAVQFTL